MTITFPPNTLDSAQAALQKTGRAQCDEVSLRRYNAVLSDMKDKAPVKRSNISPNISPNKCWMKCWIV